MNRYWLVACLLLVVGCGESVSNNAPTPGGKDTLASENQTQETGVKKGAKKTKDEHKLAFATPEELGKQLFLALKNQDEEQYFLTYATFRDIQQIMDTVPFPDEETREQELEMARKHFEALPTTWKADYEEAQETAKQMGIPWEHTVLMSVETLREDELGVEKFTSMTIKFRCTEHPGEVYAIRMDDGIKFRKNWLFTDNMLENIHPEPE